MMRRRWMAAVLGGLVLMQAGPAEADLFGRKKADATLFAAGESALEDGFFDRAAVYFEQYIETAGDREEKALAVVALARCRLGQERPADALDLLTQRDKWARSDALADSFAYWKAQATLALGEAEVALEQIVALLDSTPVVAVQRDGLWSRGRILAGLERYEEADVHFADCIAQFPGDPILPRVWLDRALARVAAGRVEEAITHFESLVTDFDGTDPAIRGRLEVARLLEADGQFDAARSMVEPVATNDTVNSGVRYQAWSALAELAGGRTNHVDAAAAWLEAEQLAPQADLKAQAQVARAQAWLASGRTEEALELLKQAVFMAEDPVQAAGVQRFYAETLQGQGLHAEAVDAFQNYLEAFSQVGGEVDALWGKAWSLWELGRFTEAAASFDKVYTMSEDADRRVEALIKTADAYFAERQYAQAVESYALFRDSFPDHALTARASFQQADALAQLGDMPGAQAILEAIRSEAGDEAQVTEAVLQQARLYETVGAWDEAIGVYVDLVEAAAAPEIVRSARHRRGVALYRIGRFEESLTDFEAIVDEGGGFPGIEEAYYMRGWCLYMLGRDEEALAISRSFIETYPDSGLAPRVLFWLGEYYWNSAAYPEAEAQFLAYAKREPEGALVDKSLFWAARAAARQSEFRRAKDNLAAMIKARPDSPLLVEARLLQGDVLSELGQFDGAILAFEEILKHWPDSYLVDRAWGRKGDCQFTLGTGGTNGVPQQSRFEEALVSYKTVVNSPTALPDLTLQAQYKVGRCLEKMARTDEAFDAYMDVVYAYVAGAQEGARLDPFWFTRAAFSAAGMLEHQERWKEAVSIYQRVVEAGVPAAGEARKRMQRIRIEHFVLF